MTTPDARHAAAVRGARFHSAYAQELRREALRIRHGNPPRTDREIADAVHGRLGHSITSRERGLLLACASLSGGKR